MKKKNNYWEKQKRRCSLSEIYRWESERPKWHHELLTGLSIFILSPFCVRSLVRWFVFNAGTNMNYSRNPIQYPISTSFIAGRPAFQPVWSKYLFFGKKTKKKWNEMDLPSVVIWRVRHFQWHSLPTTHAVESKTW
jgi:hypothetical protein